MRIAILGIRGVPANYGGFETFAEQLGWRLIEQGHEVTVYGRNHSIPPGIRRYRGMRVVRLPAPKSKYFDTVIHSIFAAVHAAARRYDIVYVCNAANVPAVVILMLARKRVVLNVDGLEWRRAKWSRVGRAYYRVCAAIAARLPVSVVTDAKVIQSYYERAYGRRTEYFPYGTDLNSTKDDGTLDRLGLKARGYVLFVSRLEPENNAHVVIEAYASVQTGMPLAIVGDAPYASKYIASLKETQDPRVRFLGAIYGQGYRILQSHSYAYVQATEVGGTHPALVEAMGAGNAILANDVPEHRETLQDAGTYYSGAVELSERLQELIDDPRRTKAFRLAAQKRAAATYSWDAVANAYEQWFASLAGARKLVPS
jgi:glycosyltransferase involved in cell wall biosynthesis